METDKRELIRSSILIDGDSETDLEDRLDARLAACLHPLGSFLVPPFDPSHGRRLAMAIQRAVDCKAVSLFLSRTDPYSLEFAAGVGYTEDYEAIRYPLSGADRFLTSYCFKTREIVNHSAEFLRAQDRIPFSDRCRLFIDTKYIKNILSVPIVVNDSKCLGVIKCENISRVNESGEALSRDVAFVKSIAQLVGVGRQQTLYGQLLTPQSLVVPVSETKEYFQSQVEFLSRSIRTECVSIFLLDGPKPESDMLRYYAGVGYIDGYQTHVYDPKRPSLTSYVARNGVTLRKEESDLIGKTGGDIPYTGACVKWIRSGAFRNVLAIPLLDELGSCYGVLKLENKEPLQASFDEFDERVCIAFTRDRIMPSLRRSSMSPTPASMGVLRLQRLIGRELSGKATDEIMQAVETARRQDPSITAQDCADYCKLSRATYYRRAATL